MRKFKGADLSQVNKIQPRTSLRMLLLASGLLVAAIVYGLSEAKRRGGQEPEPLAPPVATVARPEFLADAFADVHDQTAEERVRLERDPLEYLKIAARTLVPAHFELEGALTLTPETAEELAAHAAEHRGDLLSARGQLTALQKRPGYSADLPEWFGSGRTEAGTPFHFVALTPGPDGPFGIGDWVRLDGLFLKELASEEPESKRWIEGPLIVTRVLERSYESLGPVAELDPAILRGLTDDTLDERPGFQGLARWLVLSWLRDMPANAIDWAQAPELDRAAMTRLVAEGEQDRGRPFRINYAEVQAMTSKRLGENPARLSHLTEGWLGNASWTGSQPVLTFIGPGERPAYAIKTPVTANLIFLKNIAYETLDGTRRLAPLFALVDIAVKPPVDAIGMRQLTLAFAGIIFVLALGIFLFVRRDQRRTRELQEKLLEARRRRRGSSAQASS